MVGENMKKALHKDFWMEIRKSKARFMSIFLIVALGVAFFSGIQAAAPDMRFSGDAYYDESCLMDLKIMGTMGLTDKDISALEEVDGVELAEGAYCVDVMVDNDDASWVAHVESLNTDVNYLSITDGRLPEKSGECFVDETFAQESGYGIGDTISFVQDEDELLQRKKYTIVGLGNSPMYVSISRGNTTLGSGEIDGFVYVMPDDFDKEVYTQVYLLLHGAKELLSYTDAYENLVEKVTSKVEEIQDVQCLARYNDVSGEAQEKLDEAKQELEDGKKTAKEELAEARQKLIDGKQELEDGKKEYEDGVQQLEDAKKEIEDGKKQIADAKEQVADGWSQLETAKQQAKSGYAQLLEAKKELDAGWSEFNTYQAQADEGYAKLNEAKSQYESGKKQLQEAKELLAQKQQELDDAKAQVEEGRQQLDQQEEQLNEKRQECQEGLAGITAGEAQLAVLQAALGDVQAQLAEKQAAYDAAVASGDYTEEQLEEMSQSLEAFRAQVNTQAQAIEAESQRLAALKAELESGAAQVEQGLLLVQQKREELASAESQFASGQAEINQGKKQLQESQAELEAGKKEIDKNQQTLDKSQAQLDASRKKLESGQAEYEAGLAEYESGQAQIQQSERTLSESEQEIQDNEQELLDAENEIAENEEKLADAKKEIEDGEKELKDGLKEYQEGKKEAQQEISDGEKKIEDAQEEIDSLEMPEWIISDRSDLPEYSDFGENADRIRNIGEVFPVMFFLVAALISLTTMTRMVEEQRTQVGTLKALGYGKYDIASKYLNYAFLATVGGSVFGVIIGQNLLPYIIMQAYGIMYHSMKTSMHINYEFKYALIASVSAVVCTIGATMFSCYKELAETPASLMRPPAPKEGKRVLLEYATFIWKRLNFTWKSSLRNLFRYKKRLFMTVFGIAGSMALLVVGYGLRDSIMGIAEEQYGNLQHYDGTIINNEDASDSQKEDLLSYMENNEKIERYTQIQLSSMTVPMEKSNLSVYVYVPENVENFSKDVTLQDRVTKEQYQLSDDGAVICEKTADMLGLEVGDDITIKSNNQEYKANVAVITENYMGHYIYMTPTVYEETFGEKAEYLDIIFTMKDEDKDSLEAVGKEILAYPAALSISYTASIADQLDRMLGSLDTVIIVLIVSAGMLAFVVLYNLNNINITERQRELATLKVLGFYDMEVSQYVFRENILLTVIGVLVGAGMGSLLHQYVITTVEVDTVMFGRVIHPASYVFSALFTCGFSAIVNFIMHYKLKKIDMVESLKSVE